MVFPHRYVAVWLILDARTLVGVGSCPRHRCTGAVVPCPMCGDSLGQVPENKVALFSNPLGDSKGGQKSAVPPPRAPDSTCRSPSSATGSRNTSELAGGQSDW